MVATANGLHIITFKVIMCRLVVELSSRICHGNLSETVSRAIPTLLKKNTLDWGKCRSTSYWTDELEEELLVANLWKR